MPSPIAKVLKNKGKIEFFRRELMIKINNMCLINKNNYFDKQIVFIKFVVENEHQWQKRTK